MGHSAISARIKIGGLRESWILVVRAKIFIRVEPTLKQDRMRGRTARLALRLTLGAAKYRRERWRSIGGPLAVRPGVHRTVGDAPIEGEARQIEGIGESIEMATETRSEIRSVQDTLRAACFAAERHAAQKRRVPLKNRSWQPAARAIPQPQNAREPRTRRRRVTNHPTHRRQSR